MNERKQGQLALKIVKTEILVARMEKSVTETEELLEKFSNFGRLTSRIEEVLSKKQDVLREKQTLLFEWTDILANAGGSHLLSSARFVASLTDD